MEIRNASANWSSGDQLNCSLFNALLRAENISHLDVPEICRIPKFHIGLTVFICFMIGILIIGTALGNFLVILAVSLVKKLQTPSNLLIVSLACSDFLVSLLVLPPGLTLLVKGYWPLDEICCDVFIAFDVLLCTSSILNLCAISIDRYLVITRPMQYAIKRTPCRMGIMIAVAWISSALISIPPMIGWKEKFKPGLCNYSENLGYQIYATFGAFYIPLIVMLVLYGRIFKLAREMAISDAKQKIRKDITDPGTGGEDDLGSPEPATPTSESRRLIRFKDTSGGDCSTPTSPSGTTGLPNGSTRDNSDPSVSTGGVGTRGGRTKVRGARTNNNSVRTRKQKANSETKAIKTLGVIMGCFTLCWLPFFIIQLLTPILKVAGVEKQVIVPLWVFEMFLWLGYLNSFLNPVIYAKFNREFRTPFKEILLFRCKSINARLRSESYAEQYGLPMHSHGARRDSAHGRRRSSDAYHPTTGRKPKLNSPPNVEEGLNGNTAKGSPAFS